MFKRSEGAPPHVNSVSVKVPRSSVPFSAPFLFLGIIKQNLNRGPRRQQKEQDLNPQP